MPRPLIEVFAEQFLDWEVVGRGGLPVLGEPVAPEPPFTPFGGYRMPGRKPYVDTGHRPSLLGRLLGSRARTITPEDFVGDELEEVSPPSFALCPREYPVEIAVYLPDGFVPAPGSHEALMRELDSFKEPVGFEVVARHGQIEVQFSVAPSDAVHLEGSLKAYFPDAVLDVRSDGLLDAWECGEAAAVVDCSLREIFLLPIAHSHRIDPLVGIVGAMADLPTDCCGVYQVLFQRVLHPWDRSIRGAVFANDGEPVFPDEKTLAKAAEEKASQRLYGVVVRLAASAPDYEGVWRTLTRLGSACGAFADLNGNSLQPVEAGDYPEEAHEVDLAMRQTRRFGMLLGEEELIALAHLPGASVRTPELKRHVARTHPAPENLVGDGSPSHGLYLGTNIHRGQKRHVHLNEDMRVRHMHVVGTPGSGKSNLLQNMICDDIARGEGVAVLDPHGDLIENILERIPHNRLRDVVLLDPNDETASVGFNILSASSEAERILLSSDLVSMFERLSSSWGDQMNVILRNAINAFLNSDRGGTLGDLRRFLVDDDFRDAFVPTIRDIHVREYWEVYFKLAAKASVASIVTRLGELLESPTLRYVLGQKKSTINFGDILNSQKIFLCKLPSGLIGEKDAHLFGSLVVSKLQQTAMARQSMAIEDRTPFWLYVDEFHNFITPSMAQIISETRKYRMGLILAHQRLQQLDEAKDVATAVDGMSTKIAFLLSDRDAKKMGEGFVHFAAEDLLRLNPGEAIVRVGRSDHDFNLYVPLSEKPDPHEAMRTSRAAIEMSRQRYSRPRAEIEEEMAKGLATPQSASPPPPADGGKPKPETADGVPQDTASESPEPIRPKPPKESKPAEGRGGKEHRSTVARLGEFAAELGMLSRIEKPIEGGGYVDIEIEAPAGAVAFEICITTDTKNEIANIEKCAAAGYRRIATVCRNKAKAKAIARGIEQAELGETVQWYSLRYPLDFEEIKTLLDGDSGRAETNVEADLPAPTAPPKEPGKDSVVGSRRVRKRFAENDPAAARLAERSLKIIAELMARPDNREG